MFDYFERKADIKKVLAAAGISIAVSMLTLVLSAAAVYFVEYPDKFIRPISLCALYLSSFISGIITVKIVGNKLMSSLIVGGIINFLFLLTGSAFFKPSQNAWISLLLHIAAVGVCFLGGLLGIRKNRTRAYRRRHARH